MEDIYAQFFEQSISPSAVSAGPDHTLLAVNAAWERLFGFRRHEALGKSAVELGILRDPASRARLLERLKTSGCVEDLELALHDKSGRALRVLHTITRTKLGGREYLFAALRDITGAQQAAEQQLHDASLVDELTRRERDVLRLAIAGCSNKDIAARLGISYRTVEVHRSHCIRKLGTRSLLQIRQIAESGHL